MGFLLFSIIFLPFIFIIGLIGYFVVRNVFFVVGGIYLLLLPLFKDAHLPYFLTHSVSISALFGALLAMGLIKYEEKLPLSPTHIVGIVVIIFFFGPILFLNML